MKSWIALFFMLGLGQTFAGAAFIDFEQKLIFPEELGGMTFDRVEKYSNEALGYSLFYAKGDTFQAEVSISNLGHDTIVDGHTAAEKAQISKRLKIMLERQQDNKEISDLRRRGSNIVPNKGPLRFAYTVFQYKNAEGDQRLHAVYATGARDNYIKIEFVFDLTAGKQGSAMADKMQAQLVKLLRSRPNNQALLLSACDVLLLNPTSYGGQRSAQYVMGEAEKMGNLNIYPELFAWPDGWRTPKNANLLIAAYFAGMMKVVVPKKLDSGGDAEAFMAMISAYETMRANETIEVIPKLDEWAKAPNKRVLFNQLMVEFEYQHAE